MQNDLASSGSPYLHQHAEQPVAWQQWSEETRARATEKDVPLFISIGYATCHWCHVMAHESFDDAGIADLLNQHFVPVKIDREERPDVDMFYMAACQATGKRGGWPLTVVALPDGSPFYVATYLPRDSVPGRAGLAEVLQRISLVWKKRRTHVSDASEALLHALRQSVLVDRRHNSDDIPTALRAMERHVSETTDAVYGGFGDAPKFPTWHQIRFMLRGGETTHADVHRMLLAMRCGGIWDHVGGGFHRYSTDARWHLPHFEKMLYDQAWAVRTYSEAAVVLKDPWMRETVMALLQTLDLDFRSDGSLYYAAWDADTDGEEGRYQTWSWDELGVVLGEKGRARLADVFDIRPEGNYDDEATRQPSGRNVLHCKDIHKLPIVSQELETLRGARALRTPPLCDRKLLADWNGMTLTALATAGRLLRIGEAMERAVALGDAAWVRFMGTGQLLRSGFGDETRIAGQLDDYAFLAEGYLMLSELTGRMSDLEKARILMLQSRDRLFDKRTGTWYVSAETDTPIRMQRHHDEAYGSGTAALLRNMAILSRLFPDDGWDVDHRSLSSSLVSAAVQLPGAFTGTGTILYEDAAGRGELTIEADREHRLFDAAMRLFAPQLFLLSGDVANISPYTTDARKADASIQICIGSTCDRPIVEPEALQPYTLTSDADGS